MHDARLFLREDKELRRETSSCRSDGDSLSDASCSCFWVFGYSEENSEKSLQAVENIELKFIKAILSGSKLLNLFLFLTPCIRFTKVMFIVYVVISPFVYK